MPQGSYLLDDVKIKVEGESQMKAFIDTMHIDLSSPEKPPYILSDK